MKHLAYRLCLVVMAAFLTSTSSFAQSNTLFNPDYNGDGFIGVDDILGALSFYNTDWGGPVDVESGCTDPSYMEYDPSAIADDGSCTTVFTCGDGVAYHGYNYPTVLIGEQCWFQLDLQSAYFKNGEEIPQDMPPDEWGSTIQPAVSSLWYGPNNSSRRFYNVFSVRDSRGLCPTGWYVPKSADWLELIEFLGGAQVAGGKMKSTSGWWSGGNGTNESGFTGEATGSFDGDNRYLDEFYGYWMEDDPTNARYLLLSRYHGMAEHRFVNPTSGLSVRCIRGPFPGCTDPAFQEYNPTSLLDDGSCSTPHVIGCADVEACNYDDNVTLPDESCFYPVAGSCDFQCGDDIVFEGYTYTTELIGGNCWFTQNLRNTPSVAPFMDISCGQLVTQVWGYYGSDVSEAQTMVQAGANVYYSPFYIEADNACPTGFRTPTSLELSSLSVEDIEISETSLTCFGATFDGISNYWYRNPEEIGMYSLHHSGPSWEQGSSSGVDFSLSHIKCVLD